MTPEIRIAAHHLIWVWYMYGGGTNSKDGFIQLEHRNMQAGEQAAEFLENLGLGEDMGYHFELNRAGMALWEWDPAMESDYGISANGP